jgi:hypothetical protein
MTSANSMQTFAGYGRARFRAATGGLVVAAAVLCGCSGQEKLKPPTPLGSPYDRPQLWAIAPFANESGVSIVMSDRVADQFAEQVENIDGVSAVPVNRVLTAMQRLKMRSIQSPADVTSLMNVLGVDGLIIGTVTAYDPYPPPKFGAAVQLWRREAQLTAMLDPVELSRAGADRASMGTLPSQEPAAQTSGIFDAANHQTLVWLDEFATGRAEPNSPYGKRIYQVNMELYTQFAAYRLLRDLLEIERARLHPEARATKR